MTEGIREGESERNSTRVKLSSKINGPSRTEGFLLKDGMKCQTDFVVPVTSDAYTIHPQFADRPRT